MPAPASIYGGSLVLDPDQAFLVFTEAIKDTDLIGMLGPNMGLVGQADGSLSPVTPDDGPYSWAHIGGKSTEIEALANSGNVFLKWVLPCYRPNNPLAVNKRFAPTPTIFGFGAPPPPSSGWVQQATPPFVPGMYALRLLGDNPATWFAAESDLRGANHDAALDWFHLNWPYAEAQQWAGAPNDPAFASQWSIQHIGVPAVWQSQMGSDAVKVAILDSGLDMAHVDFQSPKLMHNSAVKVAAAFNSADVVTTPGVSSAVGHGTYTAGVIAALANNGSCIAGIAPGSPFFPVQIGDSAWLVGNTVQVYLAGSELAIGVAWARSQDSRVVHLGVDLDLASEGMLELTNQILSEAVDAGLCLIAPAGNFFIANPNEVAYPARHPAVIAVGASRQPFGSTGAPEEVWPFSQSGRGLTLVAPGESIVTTDIGSKVNPTFSATSSAAPHVTGTVALMLSENPALSPMDVACILAKTADKVPHAPGRYAVDGPFGPYDDRMGYGRLNAHAAWKRASQAIPGECQPSETTTLAPEGPLGKGVPRMNVENDPKPGMPKTAQEGTYNPMKDCDFSGGGIASPMLVLLAGYVAGLERCCCGGHGGVVRSEGPEPGGSKGSYPGPIVSPRPDAINGAVWHDLNSNWQNDDGTGAYMGVSPRGVQVTLVGPIGEQSPQQQMLTNSDGVYEFANLVPGFYKLLVQRDATGVQGAAVTLVLGSEETNILHQPNQYHRQDFAYR